MEVSLRIANAPPDNSVASFSPWDSLNLWEVVFPATRIDLPPIQTDPQIARTNPFSPMRFGLEFVDGGFIYVFTMESAGHVQPNFKKLVAQICGFDTCR